MFTSAPASDGLPDLRSEPDRDLGTALSRAREKRCMLSSFSINYLLKISIFRKSFVVEEKDDKFLMWHRVAAST